MSVLDLIVVTITSFALFVGFSYVTAGAVFFIKDWLDEQKIKKDKN